MRFNVSLEAILFVLAVIISIIDKFALLEIYISNLALGCVVLICTSIIIVYIKHYGIRK